MSSILKALKEIETGTSPFVGFQLNETLIDIRKVMTSRVKRVRRRRYISSFLFILLMLVVCLWVSVQFYPWLSFSLFSHQSTPAPLDAQHTDPPRQIASSPEIKPPLPVASEQKKTDADISLKFKPRQAKATVKAETRPMEPVMAKTVPPPKTAPAPTIPQKNDRLATDGEPASIQPLDDTGFKLQAIAWSAVAHQRMAVINGQIYHEGQTLDRFLIASIREDEVIVRSGNAFWRIEFRVKKRRPTE